MTGRRDALSGKKNQRHNCATHTAHSHQHTRTNRIIAVVVTPKNIPSHQLSVIVAPHERPRSNWRPFNCLQTAARAHSAHMILLLLSNIAVEVTLRRERQTAPVVLGKFFEWKKPSFRTAPRFPVCQVGGEEEQIGGVRLRRNVSHTYFE